MARPNSIADVTDRYNEVATFDLTSINTSPILLKAYIAFVESAQRQNGIAKRSKYNAASISVAMPKDKEELAAQLEYDQQRWDNRKSYYDKAIAGEEMHGYQFDIAKEFAMNEGLEFDVVHVDIDA